MKKAALHNLGCKVNAYETQSMEEMLVKDGYSIVDFEKEIADLYIINTCSVTNMADRKSRQMIHRAKKMNPDAIVVACGCYVQAFAEDVLKDAAVDIAVGNNRKKDLISILHAYENGENLSEYNNVIDISATNEYEKLAIETVSEHTRAYIKVQDGCNQFCTYCIIPYTRGRIRSRNIEEVITEVKRLVSNNYKEVVLTGIHLSSYGLDIKDDNITLLDLINEVSKVKGIERIRLGSLEPRIITEEFALTLSKNKKICPHFHLSLQSGCDETLKRMNRKYDTAMYMKGCQILRKHFDNPAITTDVIVGFPQETDEEFEITRKYLDKIKFYEMHVFKYSKRKGTVAATMQGQVPDQKKNDRSDILIELNHKNSLEYRKNLIGKKVSVLFEEAVMVDGESYFVGHTTTYVKIAVRRSEVSKSLENLILDVNVKEMLTDEIMIGKIED